MPRENRAKAASLPLTQARKQADQQVPEGYKLMSGSGHTPFLHHIGPLFYKKDELGKLVVAIQPQIWNLNGLGYVHGGCLMSLADFTMCSAAMQSREEAVVSVNFDAQFINPATGSRLIECHAEVIRTAGSLVFLRGEVRSKTRTVLSYSGVAKRLIRS